MFCKSDIDNLKTDMQAQIGQKILIKGTLGRSKVFEKIGTVQNVYSNLFVVKCEEEEGNTSYNYTDVLTKSVEVSIFNGTDYSPLDIPIFDEKRLRNWLHYKNNSGLTCIYRIQVGPLKLFIYEI